MSQTPFLSIVATGAAAVLLSASGAAAQTAAERPGFYLGGGYTYFQFEGDNGVDTEVNGATGRAGWQFNQWFAVEGDVSFGFEDGDFTFDADEEDFNLDDNSDGDVADIINAPGEFGMNYMIGAFAKGSYPFSDMFAVYGRLGYAFFDVDSTVTTPGGNEISLGDSESGVSYGAGVEVSFTERQSVRGEYTFTDFDLAESDALGIAYQFKF
jgi:opacity protein-like surface antigen